MPSDYLPVLIALAIALALGAGMLWMSAHMGSRSGGRVKLSSYESGAPLLDSARKRVSIVFFLVAIDFVIFDVEVALLIPWVLVLREGSWPLFWAVMIFVFFLCIGLVYVWRKGGLEIFEERAPRDSGERKS